MRKLLFAINPISGGIDKNGLRSNIADWCDDSTTPDFTFFETSGKNDSEKLRKKIDDYKPTAVIACGGDGTVNMVAQVLLENENIKLGIIPLGSANGLATELEIEEDTEAALDIVFKGKSKKVDVLQINDQHLCLHLSDIGLNAKLIKRFEKGSNRGKIGYARHFFETLFNKKALTYKFETPEGIFEEKAEMVVFANAREYGTGAVVNPIGRLDDQQFEVCIFKPYPWYAIFRLTYLFFTGKLNYSPFVKIFSTKEVLVICEKSEHLQIDGETVGKHKKVKVALTKKQLNVFVP
ncbi:diacylglycerol kinase family lipid kinase [Fulvivirga sp. RKSG066]|uniref:diacylglycerol/lipid kinase family protein n=1 Tax=Fulvivirga aurantia TaxID=2529383 RepID=UPI0012BD6D43|nr:diacylglycerol kinase family protein [Fulvivirga aurantia]MTI19881.1 diacylglycerol kinase family lipid kinase [Fulvivirga aurantia]